MNLMLKKTVSSVLALSLMLSVSSFYSVNVYAMEAATAKEFKEQNNETLVFPDPDANYTSITEGNLVFRLYDEYAVLSGCNDDEITEVVIPASLATLGNNVFVTSISNGGYYPKFTVAEGNTNFAVEENLDKDDATDDCMLYGLRDGKKVRVIGYHYPKAKTADKTIIFNKDVETVDDNALYSSPFSTVVFMEKK